MEIVQREIKVFGSNKGLLDQTTVALMKIKSELLKFDVKTGDVRNCV